MIDINGLYGCSINQTLQEPSMNQILNPEYILSHNM